MAATDGSRHIDFIDGLRAVAVLSVIAFHLNPAWLPGGFAGVDVFFVISGFVVSASLVRFEKPGLLGYLGYFYSRRLRRIAPALVVCLLVTGLATAVLVPQAWLSDTNAETGVRAFFGLSNFWLLETSGDYFAPRTEFNPYTHTWSLGVEEQFYLLFPLLFFVWSRRRRWLSVACFAALAALSLVYAAAVHGERPSLAFYMITTRFWELGAGVVLFQLLALRPPRLGPRARTGGAAAAAIVLAAGLWLADANRTPFPDGILPVLGTLGLLGFLHGGGGGSVVRSVLESRAAVAIGKVSYSLYLWHWPVFVTFRWTLGLDGIAEGAAALAITAAAAAASYRFVEQPFRHSARLVRAPRFAVVTVGLLLVATASVAFREVNDRQPQLSVSTVTAHAADWYPDGRGARGGARECGRPADAGDLAGGTVRAFSAGRCGTPSPGGQLFVAGDSHASMYDTMLRLAGAGTGRDVLVYTKGGCSVLSLRQDYLVPGCGPFGRRALEDMTRRARRGDVLFLPSLRMPRLTSQFGHVPLARIRAFDRAHHAERSRLASEAVAVRWLRPLVDRGVHVVFAGPTPVLRVPPYRCADGYSRSNPICRPGLGVERALLDEFRQPVLGSYRRVQRALPGISIWDPFPLLCPSATCQAMRAGRPLFFDGDHLSGYANHFLLPHFVEHLTGLGGAQV